MKPWVKATYYGKLYWDTSHPEFKKWFIQQIEKYSKINLVKPNTTMSGTEKTDLSGIQFDRERLEDETTVLRDENQKLRDFVREVDASLYHGPDLEDKEIMEHYIEVFKLIKETARTLL